MIKKIGVVHCIATCEDCGKEWTGYKNAQAIGARHAKVYGHHVHGEVALAFWYGPKEDLPSPKLSGGEGR